MLNPPTAAVSVQVVERAQSGMAAGINNTFRQVGIAVGIAAYGALFVNRAEGEIAERAFGETPEQAHGLAEAVSSGGLEPALQGMPAMARDAAEQVAREGFFAAFNEILLIGGGLALAGAVAAVLLVRPQDIRSEGEPLPSVAA
jgi:hypothetical protein